MVEISDEQFEHMVEAAVAAIPKRFARHLNNVAFLVAREPTPEQLEAGGVLHGEKPQVGDTLLGLYEGIPLPERDDGYNMVLPDVVTVFKRPHEADALDIEELRQEVHQTVWHEVAHYFGLDHGQIEALEENDN